MTSRPLVLVLVLVLVACDRGDPRPTTGTLRGHLSDSDLRTPIAGAELRIDNPAAVPPISIMTTTDAWGTFHAELPPGLYRVEAALGDASTDNDSLVGFGNPAPLELQLRHYEREQTLSDFAKACPGVTIGNYRHATQDELDAIAKTVLERFIADPTTMADSGLLPLPHVAVLDGLNLRPLEHFTGTGWPAQLRIVTEAAVKAEAERINSVVAFVDFHAIDTTGDCAVVFVGAQRWLPSYGMGGNCCCSTKDVYVKRDGRWIYGARVASYCD